jgi:hypothetical protein
VREVHFGAGCHICINIHMLQGNVDADDKGARTVGQSSPRNRKKLTDFEFEALPPLQRSKYLAVSFEF